MSNWGDEEMKEGGFAQLEGQIKENAAENDRRFVKLETQIAETDKRLGRVEAQIEANRKETNEGFAEMRAEMGKGFAEMRSAHLALNRTLLAAAAAIVATLIGAHIL